MFCCHLEILSTSGRRGPQVFILPIMEPVLPTSDFPQSCHSYVLTSRCHIARSRVVSQFILTMFSVGLKSWGEYEDFTTRRSGPNAYSFVWSPYEKAGTMHHSLLYPQSLVCISCLVNSCEMKPVNRRLLCLWNQTYFSDTFRESRSSMQWCQPQAAQQASGEPLQGVEMHVLFLPLPQICVPTPCSRLLFNRFWWAQRQVFKAMQT